MSLPSSRNFLLLHPHDQETFHNYYNAWLVEQNQLLQELKSVSQTQTQTNSLSEQETQLRPLLNRVMDHYKQYYRVKSEWRRGHVMNLLAPTWTSSLENAYMWVGGWRPNMAFHLLSNDAVVRSRSDDLLSGTSEDEEQLANFSISPIHRMTELRTKTVQEETYINHKMAKAQECATDTDLLELSRMATELVNEDRVDEALAEKEGRFEYVVEKADNLRLRTLKGIVNLLNPMEAVHFLIAAAQLHLSFHEWGKRKDIVDRGAGTGNV